jgi:lipopolysaccharide transport system permease protein/teichoic acid transport system permease protein
MGVVNEAPAKYRSSADRPNSLDHLRHAVRDVYSRRRLIGYMVRADIRKDGKDTVLGNVWWILDPLITMMVYVLVMTVIFQRSTPDFPLFLLSAMVPFKWMTATIGSSTRAVVGNEALIKQILFPKIILPVTQSLSQIVSFGFGMLVLAVILVVLYLPHLSLNVLWVPLIAFVSYVFILGITFVVASVTVFYRDVGIVIGHLMRLLFWVSPILWSFEAAAGRGASLREAVGETGFTLLSYNPLAILIMAFRTVIYGHVAVDADGELMWTPATAPDLGLLAIVFATGVVILVIGTLIFKRLEPAFAKVL